MREGVRDKGIVKTSLSGTYGYNDPSIVIAVQPLLNSHLGTEESDRHQEVAVVERFKHESIHGPVPDPDLEMGEGGGGHPDTY